MLVDQVVEAETHKEILAFHLLVVLVLRVKETTVAQAVLVALNLLAVLAEALVQLVKLQMQ
jgi:hypothetical protein